MNPAAPLPAAAEPQAEVLQAEVHSREVARSLEAVGRAVDSPVCIGARTGPDGNREDRRHMRSA